MADIELAMLLDRLPGYVQEVVSRETTLGLLLEVVLEQERSAALHDVQSGRPLG